MRPRLAPFARLTAILLLCVLAGCSALRLGYTNGDTFLYWWLDGYVDFTDAQKPWVKRDIARLVDWHRKTQLNDYAQLLGQLKQRVRGNVTAADILADYGQIRKRATVAIDKALPELTELAMALEPEQLAYLEKKFASNNDSYRKDYLRGSVEDRQRFRFKKVMKQAEYWFGDFSSEQEEKIRAASEARPLDNEIWLAERQRRHQEMLKMLKTMKAERMSKDAAAAMLRSYADTSFDNFTYAEHRAFFDGSRQGMAELVALIINIATPEQREHAAGRLQKWIEDCRSMAAK